MNRVTVHGYHHGSRVWHRDWRLFGIVRHTGWIGTGLAAAQVFWDGYPTPIELGRVAARLARL